MYKVEYDGKTNEDFFAILYDFPQLSLGQKKYDTHQIPGRYGDLVGQTVSVGNASLTAVFSILSDTFIQNILELKKWLSGTGKLKLSDNPNRYYNVLKIDYGDIERDIRKYGRFTVTFTVDPYLYRDDGDFEYDSIRYNPYDQCAPIYQITGEGKCTLMVNGKTMTAEVGQNLTIDTRLMISYRKDGSMQNTSVTGDYEDLWLSSGESDINITEGFDLKIIPKWGYRL